jgi:hypothetical protein
MIGAHGAIVDFLAADGFGGQQEEIRNDGGREEVHGKEETDQGIVGSGGDDVGHTARRNHTKGAEDGTASIVELPRYVDGDVEGEEDDEVCIMIMMSEGKTERERGRDLLVKTKTTRERIDCQW